MRIRFPIFMCLGLLAGGQAFAFDFFESMAIRGGAGIGRLDLTDDRFQRTVVGEDGFSANATAWDVTLGFEFNRYLAVEAGHMFGGSAFQDDILIDDPTLRVSEKDKVKSSAWHGSVIGSLPVSDEVSFYGRVGLLHWKSSTRIRQTIETFNTSGTLLSSTVAEAPLSTASGDDPFYGLGVAVQVDSGLLRLEYDLSKIRTFDARNISLSIVWRFKIF